MRQDAKLGLALAMLVIGFAIAFCFPRHGDLQSWAHAQQTTATPPPVEFLPIRAHQELQVLEASSTTPGPAETLSPVPVESGTAFPQLAQAAGSVSMPSPVASLIEPHRTSLANVIDISQTSDAGPATTPVPDDWGLPATANSDSLATSANEPTVHQPAATPRTIIVQMGDTLTGIAARELGSIRFYQDIFAANRDVLASPHALKVGMKLTIPALDQAASPVPLASGAAAESSTAGASPVSLSGDASESRTARPLFERTGGAPFLSDRSNDLPVTAIDAAPSAYTVQRGDTLEDIAVKYYGTPRAVRVIRDANPQTTRDPKRLQLGAELVLPRR